MFAQQFLSDTCGTEPIDSLSAVSQPYYGNNQLLLDLVDSVEVPRIKPKHNSILTIEGGTFQEMFMIPVKAWIYREDDGTVAFPFLEEDVERLLKICNDNLEQNGVFTRLYLACTPEFVNHTDYYSDINSEADVKQMFEDHYLRPMLNIHFIRFNNMTWGGKARFPWRTTPYSMAINTALRDFDPNNYQGDDFTSNTMLHELGHCLGLLHTHANARGWSNKSNGAAGEKCYQEWVDRGARNKFTDGCFGTANRLKCEINGDMLCDTHADPEQSGNTTNTTTGCNYTGGGTDGQGWTWLPPAANDNATTNIMSYAHPDCRTDFTKMQRGVMYYWTRHHGGITSGSQHWFGKATASEFYSNDAVDVYENDNYWQADVGTVVFQDLNNEIEIDISQHHTFHGNPLQIQTGIQLITSWQHCDRDWVYFEVTNTGNYIIKTHQVDNEFSPDTRISLHSIDVSNGTLLAEIANNDDADINTVFSEISQTLTPGFYAIEVEYTFVTQPNAGVNTHQPYHYYLSVFECFDRSALLDVQIQGPSDLFCDVSGTYSLANLPAGFNVTWSADPNINIDPVTGVATRTSNVGTGQIYATISTQSCTSSVPLSVEVILGVPHCTVGGPLEHQGYVGCDYFSASNDLSGVYFEWQSVDMPITTSLSGCHNGTFIPISPYTAIGTPIYGAIQPFYDDITVSVRAVHLGCGEAGPWTNHRIRYDDPNEGCLNCGDLIIPDPIMPDAWSGGTGTSIQLYNSLGELVWEDDRLHTLEKIQHQGLPVGDYVVHLKKEGQSLEEQSISVRSSKDLLIYPNPSEGMIHLGLHPRNYKFQDFDTCLELEVYDSVGNLVFETNQANLQEAVDMSSVPAGLYILHILKDGKMLKTEKLVIQK